MYIYLHIYKGQERERARERERERRKRDDLRFHNPFFGVGTWENILKAVIKVRSWKWSHRASAPSCTSLDGDIRRPPEIPYWWRRPHRWWSKSLETPMPCPVSSHDTWPCAPLPQRCPRNRMRTPQSMKWTSPVQPTSHKDVGAVLQPVVPKQ